MGELVALPEPPAGVQWTSRGLVVTDPSLPFEQFEAILGAASEIKTAMSFVIGDLLNFAEARYGERYTQAIDATGYAYSTLSNYAYVMRRVVRSRRREKLSFGHHEAVASLEPDEQDRWLGEAEENRWTRTELREKIQDAGRIAAPPPRRARQEVMPLASETVDVARNLAETRETLVALGSRLEPETAAAAGIPSMLRAIDEVGATVRKATEALPTILDAARRVVKNATVSGGFYMVEEAVFQELAAMVAAE